jgi:hypothetical protein
MARTRVFQQDGQTGCRGTPFAENHGGPDRETAGRVRSIDLVHQEFLAHHDPRAVEPPAPEPGTVVLAGTGRAPEAVPGTRTWEPVDSRPRWFDESEDDEQPPRQVPYRVRRAVGVLVTPEVPDGTPPQPGDRR